MFGSCWIYYWLCARARYNILKILQVGSGFNSIPPKGAGAVETVIHNLSKELVNRGNDVCVLDVSSNRKAKVPYEHVTASSANYSRNILGHIFSGLHFGITSSRLLTELLKKEEFDVVHFHNQFSGFCGVNVTNHYKIPSVYTLHNSVWMSSKECMSFRNKIKFGQEIASLRKVTRIIALSQIARDNIVRYLNVDSHKIDVVPNGIDVNLFRPIVKNCGFKRKIAPNGEIVFLNVARVAKYKNQMSLVKAISYLVKKCTNVKFIFVGPIDDIRYFSQIQAIILKENLQEYVKFYGEVSFDMLLKLYSLADVFVLPSIMEGLPLVILEAMACGNAVVVSNIGPLRELIEGVGFLVNPYNPREIATSLLSLVNEKEKLEKMKRKSRETVVNDFTWSSISERVERIYEILARARG